MTAVPLTFRPLDRWPGQPTRTRKRSQFRADYRDTTDLLDRELAALRARTVIVQLDCDEREIRRDGIPRADARVRGPGVIVSFEAAHGPVAFPCDTFSDWQDNLRAIAKALEALRLVDRYGVTRNGEQYQGWKALPAPAPKVFPTARDAAAWLAGQLGLGGIPVPVPSAVVPAIRAKAISQFHPDRNGGDSTLWKKWTLAASAWGSRCSVRNMSCQYTTEPVRNRNKTVTRRLGWQHLRAGDLLCLCEKCMGRRPGEPLVRLAVVMVLAINTEELSIISPAEVQREGFPGMTPAEFVAMFCHHMNCRPETMVVRIEWRYLPGGRF